MAYTRRTQYARATFGSSGDNQQKSILSVSYGYTKGRGLANGATTINLNHTVPAGATMKVVTRNNSTGATTIANATSYTSPAAAATLTSTGTAPANNDTVTIGSRTYTFKTTLTGAANEVLIGASAAAALDNLKSAINATAGAGTTYGTGTTAHADVTATTNTDTTQVIEAKTTGPSGNGIATSESSAQLSWGGTATTGGQANSVATIPTAVATGSTYTVHYFFSNWHIDPVNDQPVYSDSGLV